MRLFDSVFANSYFGGCDEIRSRDLYSFSRISIFRYSALSWRLFHHQMILRCRRMVRTHMRRSRRGADTGEIVVQLLRWCKSWMFSWRIAFALEIELRLFVFLSWLLAFYTMLLTTFWLVFLSKLCMTEKRRVGGCRLLWYCLLNGALCSSRECSRTAGVSTTDIVGRYCWMFCVCRVPQ